MIDPRLFARLGALLFQRMAFRPPAVDAFGIPDDIRVAHRKRALRRVPRHPAILEAIEDERPRLVACRRLLKSLVEIGLRLRRDGPVADVREPQASRDAVMPLFTPDGGGRQIRGLGRVGQHIDKRSRLVAPQMESAVRIDDPCAGERSRGRRAIVFGAIPRRLRRAIVCDDRVDRRTGDQQNRADACAQAATKILHAVLSSAAETIAHVMRTPRPGQAIRAACALAGLATLLVTQNLAIAADETFVRQIAPGVYAHQGLVALTSPANRGDIANIGFIVGDDAVAVIDCGGSVAVGDQLLAAVRAVTDKPIKYVVLTHVHPDHIFGAAAFTTTGAIFVGHRNLPRALAARGEYYLRSFRAQLGDEVARVKIVVPSLLVENQTTLDLGNRQIELKAWKTSHTDNDLTIFDPKSGVMFTGDLVFLQHTPIVDGSLLGFLKVIGELEKIPATRVVPGHGALGVEWPKAVADEKRYFEILARDLRQLSKKGADIEQAAGEAGQSERGNWALFDNFAPRNATAGLAEIEWE